MTLPYRWYPSGTRITYDNPAPGTLIAWNHAAWRIISVERRPEDLWSEESREQVREYGDRYSPYAVVLRPVDASDDPKDWGRDEHVESRHSLWHVYDDEHYPVCAKCLEPVPCREEMAEREAAKASAHMSRYETPGTCPACEEPVTVRQRSMTFPDNMEIPGGPAVTFHVGRYGCRRSAGDYEKRWIEADPTRGRPTLSCEGHVINHNDSTYECTMMADCSGPAADHQSLSTCRCLDCHALGSFDCHPSPTAQRVDRRVPRPTLFDAELPGEADTAGAGRG